LSLAASLVNRPLTLTENLGIQTVEELGLLKLADKLNLLSLAEDVVTNPSTPALLAVGSFLLGGLAYLDATAPDFGFLQSVLAGALGAPAVVLLGAAVVIFGLTAGTSRNRPLAREDKIVTYGDSGFSTQEVVEDATLIGTLAKRRVLSYVEENRLLSLAASLVNRPLTLTENLGILRTLENSKLLSAIESQAADKYGALKAGGLGLLLLPIAVLAFFFLPDVANLLVALALGLAALPSLAIGIAIGVANPPDRFTR